MAARTEDEDEDESLVQDMLRRSLIPPPPQEHLWLGSRVLGSGGGEVFRYHWVEAATSGLPLSSSLGGGDVE